MTDRTYTLTVPGALWTVNAERRRHWAWRAQLAKQWRTDAFYMARGAQIPRLAGATFTVRPEQAKGRLADPEAHAGPWKAVLDGLVDAKVLPDDTGEYVHGVTFLPPIRSDMDRLRIEITEVVSETA